MPVTFDDLCIGCEYERIELAQRWGYASHHAISRGVFTPSGTPYIILFVTEEKQRSQRQYNDRIEGSVLHWEGEEKHANDERIARAHERGEEIHLFHRNRHHSPFTYLGPIVLRRWEQRTGKPSRFEFDVLSLSHPDDSDPFSDVEQHQHELTTLDETERQALIQSRVGQGRFRREVLKLWNGCAVTGLRDERVLLASHVKPWKASNNHERLDSHNGLALTPNLDRLFNDGLITFDVEGKIRISAAIDRETVDALGVHSNMRLRMIPERLERYLRFHRKFVFRDSMERAPVMGGNSE